MTKDERQGSDMENVSKREKILFWLIKHSDKPLLWVAVIFGSAILTNTGIPVLIGLGVTIVGILAFAAGVNMALEAVLGDDYAQKLGWKYKEKEKTNDTTH